MPPRYLLGPLARNPGWPLAFPPADIWRPFGTTHAEIALWPTDSWRSIAGRLPHAWQPEAVVVVLGQGDIPVGLWSAPVPLVALAPNGFRSWHACRHVLPRCDLVVTDAETAPRLRRQGIEHLHVPTRWDETSTPLTPAASPISRDIDLLFLGDFQSARQRERLSRLGRLARLGTRWRVLFQRTSKQHDPQNLFRRTRIYFHHCSETAGIHRLWAAAAAAALPFIPAGADCAGALWQDRRNCVRYPADNLEALLEHYLENEEERRRLAEAAQKTALSSTIVGLWSELRTVLEREGVALAERAALRTVWDRNNELLARAWQAVGDNRLTDERLITDLAAAVNAVPSQTSLRHALGLMAAAQGHHTTAAEHFRHVLEREPRHVLAGLYRAEALVRAERSQEAVAQARQTLSLLDGSEQLDPSLLDSPPYPPGRDVFGVEWEQAAWQHPGDAKNECRAKLTLLRWRLHGLLARQTGELIHRYEAALARPNLPATRATLGSALHQAGRHAEAAHHLRQAVAANPFDVAAPRLLYEALGLLGLHAEQQQLIEERRLLHQTAPQVIAAEDWFMPQPLRIVTLSRPHVSLCMIVKDEEANLPRCLGSASDLVQEIIVVDTGSRDATKDVARRCGAKVYDFAWCDSFAAARNESIRHATGEWIFWLDADDTLDAANRQKLRTLFDGLGRELAAYLMRQQSLPDAVNGTGLVVDQAKLFRNDPRVRWEYRVHEQIVPAILRLGGVTRATDIVFHHSGYQDPRVRRQKLERNRRLLLLDQAERPDDPLTLFNLGTLHLDVARPAEAVAFFQRGLERAPANYSLVPSLHGLLTSALYRLGRKDEALAACRRGRAAFPDEGALINWEAQILSETGDLTGAEANWRRLLSLPVGPALSCLDPGIHGYKTRHQLAQLCRRQGRIGEAEQFWRESAAERPDFVPAWLELTELYLSAGREAELAADLARLESEVATRATAWIVRSRVHLAHREFAAARALLEEAVRSSPRQLWARLLLGQALVQEGRDRDAAQQVLREALALDPHQPEARRLLASLETVEEFAV